MGYLRIILTGLVVCWSAMSAHAADLSALARLDPEASGIADAGDGIGVDLAISQPVPFRVLHLDNPQRLVVDFREVDFGPSRPGALNRSSRVVEVGWGPFRPGWSRMVLALDGDYVLQTAEERGADDGGAVLRIVLAPTDAARFMQAVERDRLAAVADASAWALPDPAAVDEPKRRQTGDAPLVVVIDPGHGGIDPGAEADGMTEAHVILTFARELAEQLRRAGMTVILTREEDVFVPLETRVSVARAAGADLFLSLHADALAEGTATGATVYTLDDAARDEASIRLAERHDRADLLAGVDLQGHDDEVAGVLMDLARAETTPRSDRLAADLVSAIGGAKLKMHRHPLQSAEFSVLKAADIPSVLLEVGFLSSAKDRARLSDPVWRDAMQGAILDALTNWQAADAAEARLLRQ
jgi:N-acetylmuramoyl-L-alanine amidase